MRTLKQIDPVAQAKRQADRAEKVAQMKTQLKVGSLLHYAWGYGQTQCEFYQVIAIMKASVLIRQIKAATVPGSEGSECDYRRPVKDMFLGPKDGPLEAKVGTPKLKRVAPDGVKMRFGIASPCNETDKFYCSWYY